MKIVDGVLLDNMKGLLEECIVNGDHGMKNLFAWFLDQRHLIIRVLEDLDE